MDKLYKVGEYINKYNQILNINLPCISIYASKGLRKHIETRHNNCVDYIEKIPDIIKIPILLVQIPKNQTV